MPNKFRVAVRLVDGTKEIYDMAGEYDGHWSARHEVIRALLPRKAKAILVQVK